MTISFLIQKLYCILQSRPSLYTAKAFWAKLVLRNQDDDDDDYDDNDGANYEGDDDFDDNDYNDVDDHDHGAKRYAGNAILNT